MLTIYVALPLTLIAAEQKDVCVNGGFERLNPAGNNFPLNWGDGGAGVTIDKEAHSGAIAVRMSAGEGVSIAFNSQEIPIRRGTMTFWYKAIGSAADGANLRAFVVGMVHGRGEVTRVGYTVPKAHVGDGQWHQGTVDFDYGTTGAVDCVLVAPRVNENDKPVKGEWLIDDFAVIERRIGAKAEFEAVYMPDPILQIDQPRDLIVQVANSGDAPLAASRLRIDRTPELDGFVSIAPASEWAVPELAPNQSYRVTWKLTGKKKSQFNVTIEWAAAGAPLFRSRPLVCIEKPELRELCTGVGGMWRFMPKPVSLQEGDSAPLTPLQPKKSSELPDSYMGVTSHVPRGHDFERIFEPEFLIDGKPDTSWSGRAHATPVPGAVDYAQVDLPAAEKIKEIRLLPYFRGEGFPFDFVVKLRSGGAWTIVHQVTRAKVPACTATDKQPYVIPLSPSVSADAVRIEVTRFSPCAGFFSDCATTYYLRLSEIEAIDDAGENVALASKGAKVEVPWTFASYFNSAASTRETFSEMYNLGVKWNRIGQWGDWTCWAIVEQKKGEYYMDPTTDAAITESVKNGVNILYTLDYGNPLYEPQPPLADNGPVWCYGHPFRGHGGPTKPETIRGFVNYAKFVANHFKGRVKNYEIWNEENSWAWYGSPPDPKAFGTLLRETAKALKEIDPEIKVMSGGTAALAPTFITQALAEGGGKYLDSVAFHPYTMPYPEMGLGALDVVDGKQIGKPREELGFTTWREMIAYLGKTFRPFNDKFDFWANEWNVIPTREDVAYQGETEIRQAKHIARFFTMCTLTRVHGVIWSLLSENTVYDWGILRCGTHDPAPVYYTIQAMTTLLSGAVADSAVKITPLTEAPSLMLEPMRGRQGETMIAVWSAVPPQDDYGVRRVSLKIAGLAGVKSAEAVDTLHAVVQKLNTKVQGDALVVENVLVPDYPVILVIR